MLLKKFMVQFKTTNYFHKNFVKRLTIKKVLNFNGFCRIAQFRGTGKNAAKSCFVPKNKVLLTYKSSLG